MNFNVLNLIRCKYTQEVDGNQEYSIILTNPAKGVLYVTQDCPYYISGQIRVRGRDNGSYPYNYLEMIDAVFGKEDNTIEVCSGMIKKYGYKPCSVTIRLSSPQIVPVLSVRILIYRSLRLLLNPYIITSSHHISS